MVSKSTVPRCVPWMGHLCVLPASKLTGCRSTAGDDLCLLPVVNKPGALIAHTQKNVSAFQQPRKDSSFGNPAELWLVLRARCLKSRQMWLEAKANVGLLETSWLSLSSPLWRGTVASWWNKLSEFPLALWVFFSWEISCQLCNSFHWLSREVQPSQRQWSKK